MPLHTHSTDLVTVHTVAMPQGKDLPERDGNGKADHSNGKGIPRKRFEQLYLGCHWRYQPGGNTCKVSAWSWL